MKAAERAARIKALKEDLETIAVLAVGIFLGIVGGFYAVGVMYG